MSRILIGPERHTPLNEARWAAAALKIGAIEALNRDGAWLARASDRERGDWWDAQMVQHVKREMEGWPCRWPCRP